MEGHAEVKEVLLHRLVIGPGHWEQVGGVDTHGSGEGEELMKRDALMSGFDVGQRGAAHSHLVGNALLGELPRAAMLTQRLAKVAVLPLEGRHSPIVRPTRAIVNQPVEMSCSRDRPYVSVADIS